MKRRTFIANGLGFMCMPFCSSAFASLKEILPYTPTMPALFVGHGSPMNAIEENRFSKGWKDLRKTIPEPKAILCVSAHWLTQGSFVSTTLKPKTIHDFGGFPPELFEKQYPAPGAPEAAEMVLDIARKRADGSEIHSDNDRGLDHGTWSVLAQMYPEATIPVFQLSINYDQPMAYHYHFARQLTELRNRGVLILGSGNIVHNLGRLQSLDQGYEWAIEFDEAIKLRLLAGDHQAVIAYDKVGLAAELSVPTPDHYIPLLYTIGAQLPTDRVRFTNEWLTKGAISMRTVIIEEV